MKFSTIARWMLVPFAAFLGLVGAVILAIPINRLFHMILWNLGHQMPGKDFIAFVLPYDGVMAGFLFVLFGCIFAPSHRKLIGIILLCLGAALAWTQVGQFYSSAWHIDGPKRVWWPFIGTCAGGILGVLIVSLRFSHKEAAEPSK